MCASCGSGGSGVGHMSLKRGLFLERPSSYWSKKAVFDVINYEIQTKQYHETSQTFFKLMSTPLSR